MRVRQLLSIEPSNMCVIKENNRHFSEALACISALVSSKRIVVYNLENSVHVIVKPLVALGAQHPTIVSELMDLLLTSKDQSQADQPNSLTKGPPMSKSKSFFNMLKQPDCQDVKTNNLIITQFAAATKNTRQCQRWRIRPRRFHTSVPIISDINKKTQLHFS